MQIFKVDGDFVGPNDLVVVGNGVGLHGQQRFLMAIFETSGAGEPGFEQKQFSVCTFQPVGIPRHIRARPDKTHVAFQDIDQLEQGVHFGASQPSPEFGNARVIRYGDMVRGNGIFRAGFLHGPNLEDHEGFPMLANPFLPKQDRSFGHQHLVQ